MFTNIKLISCLYFDLHFNFVNMVDKPADIVRGEIQVQSYFTNVTEIYTITITHY